MVNTGKRRAGLSSRRMSALRNKRSTGLGTTSRLSAMNASSVQTSRLARGKFEKLQKSASSLTEQTQLLAERADEGGKGLTATAAEVVSDFNDTLKNLKEASGVLNSYYHQSMKEIATGQRKELESVGITVAADGKLTLDKEKLAEADAEKVKAVLGSDSVFAKRVNAVASRAADNARASAESASSQYTAAGGFANSYIGSRYNFRG